MSLSILAKQPKPFYLIFFIEIWERFGYYGVQALLVLYMVQKLDFTDEKAYALFGAFSALVYLLPALGGYVGDRILGTKRTIVLGAVFLALGYLLLSLPVLNVNLVLPLAVIAIGNGFFKANPSSLLSKVYQGTHYNLDSGFTLYYMAVNVGAFVSMNLTPILNRFFGWYVAFSVCFIGLIIALLNFLFMRKVVRNFGSVPDHKPMRWDYLLYILFGAAALIMGGYFLLSHREVMSTLLTVGTVVLFLFYFRFLQKANLPERKGMLLFFILFFQGIGFFILYFQMPTSLTLFALRNVEPDILGIPIQPAQFQMLNAFWIMIMSPVLAIFYQLLHKHGRDLSLPSKFALGTFLTALAFLILPLGSLFHHNGVVSGMWMVACYFLQSVGELLVSALGLSLAARFIPHRLMGFAMGLWFLCTSIASMIAAKVASVASIPHGVSSVPLLSLPIYNRLFLEIGLVTLIVSGLMFIAVPMLKKLASAEQMINP